MYQAHRASGLLLARGKAFTESFVVRDWALCSRENQLVGLSATKNSVLYQRRVAFSYACYDFFFPYKHNMWVDMNVQSAVWTNRAYFIHSEQTMVLRKDKGVYDSSAIFGEHFGSFRELEEINAMQANHHSRWRRDRPINVPQTYLVVFPTWRVSGLTSLSLFLQILKSCVVLTEFVFYFRYRPLSRWFRW